MVYELEDESITTEIHISFISGTLCYLMYPHLENGHYCKTETGGHVEVFHVALGVKMREAEFNNNLGRHSKSVRPNRQQAESSGD